MKTKAIRFRLILPLCALLAAGGYLLLRQIYGVENAETGGKHAVTSGAAGSAPRLGIIRNLSAADLERMRNEGIITEPVAVRSKPGSPPTPERLIESAKGYRENLDAHYATLFEKLNLSEGDMERFREFLVERQLLIIIAATNLNPELRQAATVRMPTQWDPKSNVMLQGNYLVPTRDSSVMNATIAAVSALADESSRPLLGEDNYTHYKFYMDTLGFRSAVIDHLDLSQGDALLPAQVDQLLSSLSASYPIANTSYPQPKQPSVTPEVMAEARDFLTPAQFVALQKMAEGQARDAAMITEALRKLEESESGAK